MVQGSLQSALESLKAERARIDDAIAALEGLVSRRGPGRPAGRGVGKVAKAPRAAGKAKGRKGGRKRKNAPRGLLKQKIHEVLGKARSPLAPVKLRDAVIAAGYPAKNPQALYTAIFAATKSDPKVKKSSAGYSLSKKKK